MKHVIVFGLLLVTSVTGSAQPDHVSIRFHYSHFEPDSVTVPAGVPVVITLRNDDPIDHEWIVGPPVVHEIHRHGTEAVHTERPTEVPVPQPGLELMELPRSGPAVERRR
jgi:hypothetical protein